MKVRVKVSSIVFMALFLTLACKDDDEDNEETEFVANVIEVNVKDTISINEVLKASIVIGTPTPCYDFVRCEIAENENLKAITAYAKSTIKQGEVCITTVGRINAKISMTFSKTGNQLLIFNPNTANQIIDTVYVK